MRKSEFLLMCGIAIMARATSAVAAEEVIMQAGSGAGPSVVVAVDKSATPRTIAVRTMRVGVAGARIDILIDKDRTPVLHHILTADECKFGDSGSVCQVVIPAKDAAYRKIVAEFRKGRVAHVTIMVAGVMKMDLSVSLHGIARALR
jgi:hypothetical protein